VGYRRRVPQVSTWGARTIRVGGVLLLLFIPLHIAHFTWRTWRPAGTFMEGDVYGNVVGSFRIWWVTLIYVVGMIVIGLHLYHGAWSVLRTLGLKKLSSGDPFKRRLAAGLAILIWLGFTLVPVAILAGLVRPAVQGQAAAPAAAPAID
jgi:succinate dehydrogenase / fumarate reductase, cytochrome b subunit